MDEINKLVLLPFFLSFKRKIDEQHKFFFSSNTFSLCKSVLTSTSLGINLFFFIFLRITLKQYKACRTIYNLFLLLELLSCKQFIKYHTMKNISFGQKILQIREKYENSSQKSLLLGYNSNTSNRKSEKLPTEKSNQKHRECGNVDDGGKKSAKFRGRCIQAGEIVIRAPLAIFFCKQSNKKHDM